MSFERADLLSPVDAAWFRMNSDEDPADIVALLRFDGRLDEPRLRRTLEQRLLKNPRFTRRVVARGLLLPPAWEEEEGFTIDAHLFRHDVAAGEDLEEVVSRLVSRPFGFARSPWSCTILRAATGGDALLVRLHHCMGDGFALLALLVSLTDPDGEDDDEDPPRSGTRRATGGRGPLASLAHLLTMPFDPETVLRRSLTGTRRVAWAEGVALDDVKRAAHARGATVNDLLLATLSTALRRYLIAREGHASPIRAIVPVNLRPPGVPIDWTNGNWFGLVFLDLPTDIDSRERRDADLKESMATLKRSAEAGVALWLLGVMGRVPLPIERIVEAVFSHKASVVVTNVPGPRSRVRLAGVPVADLVFWVPHPCGLGLGVSILSYAGRLRIGFRADEAVVPDPHALARLFDEELAAELHHHDDQKGALP